MKWLSVCVCLFSYSCWHRGGERRLWPGNLSTVHWQAAGGEQFPCCFCQSDFTIQLLTESYTSKPTKMSQIQCFFAGMWNWMLFLMLYFLVASFKLKSCQRHVMNFHEYNIFVCYWQDLHQVPSAGHRVHYQVNASAGLDKIQSNSVFTLCLYLLSLFTVVWNIKNAYSN